MSEKIKEYLNKFILYSKKERYTIIILSIFFGFYLPFAFPLHQFVGNYFTDIIAGFLLSIILLLLSINYYPKVIRVEYKEKKTFFIGYFVISFLIWMIYFIAFFPGCICTDTLWQWEQVLNFSLLNDWHPVFHTLLIWLVTRIYESLVTFTIFQILICSLILSYAMSTLEKIDCKRTALIILTILFSFFPINGFMVINVWKDTLYSYFILFSTIILLKIFTSEGKWLSKYLNQFVLTIVLIMIFFIRHNGLLPYIGILVLLAIFYFRYIKSIILIAFISLMIIFVIKYPLYKDILKVAPVPNKIMYGTFVYQIGTAINSGIIPNSEDEETITMLGPISNWKSSYNKYNSSSYFLDEKKQLNVEAMKNNKRKFFKAYFNIVLSHPLILLEHIKNVGTYAWRIASPADFNTHFCNTFRAITYIDKNNFGYKHEYPIPFLSTFLLSLNKLILEPELEWLFSRIALGFYFSVFICILLMLKSGNKIIIILSPVILNTFILLLTSTGSDYRYFYSTLLVSFLVLGICFRKND